MRAETQLQVDTWWANLLDVPTSALWREVTLTHPSEGSPDLSEWRIAWRDQGVHLLAPTSSAADEAASMLERSPVELQQEDFWHTFAAQRSERMVGPITHLYLDQNPSVPRDVEQVDPKRLTLLRGAVTPAEWDESAIPTALADGGEALALWGTTRESTKPWVPALLGGAVLTEFAGAHRDIGVLVTPAVRGRGFGRTLGQAIASYAVSWHGWAQWSTDNSNLPSMGTATGLGFEPYVTEVRIRP